MIAAGLDAAGTAVALCRASRRRSCTVSVPNLPLDTDNDEAAPPCSGEFWVGVVSLPVRGGRDSAAWLDIGAGVGLAEPRKGRHDSGIEGELGPVPEGETVRDNFDAPRVSDRHIDTHVCEADVAGTWRQSPGRLAQRRASAAGPVVGRTPEVAQAAR